MSRTSDILGNSATFCTLRVWDEVEFCYHELVDMVRDRDAMEEMLTLHQPPLVVVISVRCGSKSARPS
jgi:hypothetical protein